jgi:magnesium-transporting ATPase (P-type)
VLRVFTRQIASPLIYVLLAAAVLSIVIREWSDAGFIFAVLLINALIGTFQEYSAQRAASALQQLVTTRCRVVLCFLSNVSSVHRSEEQTTWQKVTKRQVKTANTSVHIRLRAPDRLRQNRR